VPRIITACVPTCPFFGSSDCVVCNDDERFIRNHIHNDGSVPFMTPEEREWAIDEADRAGEGMWSREDLEPMTDSELAKAVLDAWASYVQCNCLP